MSVAVLQPPAQAAVQGQSIVTGASTQAAATANNPPGEAMPTMTYHDNWVNVPFSPGDGYQLVQATYTVTALRITDGQDPDNKNKIGDVRQWSGFNDSIKWSVGQSMSSDVAEWWKGEIHANQTTFGHDPKGLHFAFIGNLVLQIKGGKLGLNEDTYTIPGVGFAQGRSDDDRNNWWFGGMSGKSQPNDTVRLEGKSSSGFSVNFFFRRGGIGNAVNEVRLTKIEFANYTMFSIGASYVGENVSDTWQSGSGGGGKLPPYVTYYNSTQTETLRLSVKEGLIYTSNGKLFDTSTADHTHSQKAAAIFVMDGAGNVYASNQFKPFMFHSSTILAGASVASAGELQAKSGVITYMSNMSAHYRPDPDVAHRQLTESLYRQGYHQPIHMTEGDFSQLMY